MRKTPFRQLFELFQARFFENDTVSPDGGFETNIWQVLGFLAAPGFFITYLFMPEFLAMATKHLTGANYWALRMFRLFFPAFSFAVVGFATFFQWEKLFPERRDFLILGTFPIRLRTLFAAKFSALWLFLLLLIGAINFFPNVLGPLLSLAIPEVRQAGYLRLTGAQVGSAAGASLFGFFVVAGFQGLLINVTSPRIFRRISPWIQMAGMSLMILALLMFPVYSMLLPSAAGTHAAWLWLFPPIWFTGLYDLLLTPSDPLFASLGSFGGEALGVAIAVFCVTWALGFRRHYHRTLEAEDTGIHKPHVRLFDWLPRLDGRARDFSILRLHSCAQCYASYVPCVLLECRNRDRAARDHHSQGWPARAFAGRTSRLSAACCVLRGVGVSCCVPVSSGTRFQLAVSDYRGTVGGEVSPRLAQARTRERTFAGAAAISSVRDVAMG